MRKYLILILLSVPAVLLGQLSAPGSNATRYARYPSGPGKHDPVFIFCNASGTVKGSLSASSPGGTGPFSFAWNKWSDATKSFSIPVLTQNNVITSTIASLDEGGYTVHISDAGGYNTDLTGWISIDKPYVMASLQNRTCDYVALKGDTASDVFFYRDPSNGSQIRLPNKLKFIWSSTPSSSIPYPDFFLNPQTFNPPLEDVTYKLVVTDSMTCSSQSSFDYVSIHVKADFEAVPSKGEAPLRVSLKDKSKRGYTYKWEFGDSLPRIYTKTAGPDSIYHIYYKPGQYSVKLTIESQLHCTDSLRFNYVAVEPSSINIPNVFTPDGDGYNDSFTIDSKSMRFVSMEVYTQSGMKVYSFSGEGERLKEWTGWDGNINNTSIKARPGVYFYLIRAIGWDDVVWDGKEYRGFVYLYR